MVEPKLEIGFEQRGLGSVLRQNLLSVPPNQREYSWTEKEVRTLFQDLAKAIFEGETSYFLGTIVTIPRENGMLEVVDGQQRLATTAILLSAIRDYLSTREKIIAESIDNEFLTGIDRDRRDRIPRLRLNLDDNDFFKARLSGADPAPEPTKASHRLLNDAFVEACAHVEKIVTGHDEKDHGDVLNKWIEFIENRALVILLRVPSDANAYRMFETLNDRGLRTSQSDLVKNYLFGRAGERLPEVQQKWAYMKGALETMDDEDITITFLRHALIVIQGFIREAQVYDTVQSQVRAPQPVVTFTNNLEILANSYVAIHNPEHEKWNAYSGETRKAIEVLNLFNIRPMRAMMLAIAQHLPEKEAEKALKFCISLGVRLMISSSTRTGTVEEGLAEAAHGIFSNGISSSEKLLSQLSVITPSNDRFQAEFETATVSNRKLARYYLRSLEMAAKGEREPWHIPNDDPSAINLEHVLPQKPEGNWPQFSDDQVKLYFKRIGNFALLRASENSTLKSAKFGDKKAVYAGCPYVLTKQISEVGNWRMEEITERQKTLAEIALEAWPI